MRITALLRRAPKTLRNALIDLRYGGFLGGTTRTRYAALGAFDTANSDYTDLPALFGVAGVTTEDVLVDVGCGKGRAINWLLGHYPANGIIGIEIDPEICAHTARRLRRHKRVEIRCGDATTTLPPDGTIFFLFNPFDEAAMARFIATLVEAGGRKRVIYYNCKFVRSFLDNPRFEVEEIELPSGSHRSALITLPRAARMPA
jgi:SAM-dependent methyltransferase